MSKPFNGAISAFFETEAPADIRQAIMAADKDQIINPNIFKHFDICIYCKVLL